MTRGDVVIVSAPGDYGKPRPAVVIQSDYLTSAGLESVILCLMTGHMEDAPVFGVDVEPTADNGPATRSQLMVDKLMTVRRSRIGRVIGRLDEEALLRLNRTPTLVIGLAE